jgi:hypothetical protein
MALWGTKKDGTENAGGAATTTNVSGAPPAKRQIGIDHAITLVRSLPTDKNVELVIGVLKTTLESLGIRVADIVHDAANRQKELEQKIAQLKGEIASLEKEVAQRAQEIEKTEAAHAETTRVREYLETDEVDLEKQAL